MLIVSFALAMSYWFLAATALSILLAVARSKNQPAKSYPSALNTQQRYDRDIVALKQAIKGAQSKWQLNSIEESIILFQRDYKSKVDGAALGFDLNQLRIQLRQKRNAVRFTKAIV